MQRVRRQLNGENAVERPKKPFLAASSTEVYGQTKVHLETAWRVPAGKAARKLDATCSDVCLALHGNCGTRSNSARRHGPAEAVSGASNCLGGEELSAHPCQSGTAGRRAGRRFGCAYCVSSTDRYSLADKPRHGEQCLWIASPTGSRSLNLQIGRASCRERV